MMTLQRLRAMSDDQLCRWISARRGAYSAQERAALSLFLAEIMPGWMVRGVNA